MLGKHLVFKKIEQALNENKLQKKSHRRTRSLKKQNSDIACWATEKTKNLHFENFYNVKNCERGTLWDF